jgi:hypothetical protein
MAMTIWTDTTHLLKLTDPPPNYEEGNRVSEIGMRMICRGRFRLAQVVAIQYPLTEMTENARLK